MATKTYKPKRKISATESEEIKIPASSVDGLSTVATSGSYNDLSNKPTIPDVSGKANLTGGNTFTGKQTLTNPPTDGYSIDASGYVKGSWLQAPSTGKASSNTGKVCVLDGSGWVYYRTPAEIVSDGGGAKASDIPDVSGKANLDGGNDFSGVQAIYTDDGIDEAIELGGNEAIFGVDKSLTNFSVSSEQFNLWVNSFRISGQEGTSGQVLTSQGAGKTPQWTTPTKGTVTQVKINGTTKSPNSAGLVDLGTVGGGVQVLTANEVNISSLSDGMYLWKFTVGYSSFTLSGIGNTGSPQKFTFTPESYAKLATLEVNRQSTAYINFTLSYDVSNPISNGGKKTITYMYGVGKIEEYSNWVEAVDVSGGTGGALSVIGMTTKTADLKVTLLPDATTEGETTAVTVSVGGYSSTNIKNIIKSSDKFPMNLVFEKTRAGLLISETALDGAFDSFGNSNDSGIYDDEIYLGVKYTSDRSSITTDYMLNGTLISSITYS